MTGVNPTAPDKSRALWAHVVRLQAERRRYDGRQPINADDIVNLKIALSTVQDVLDFIERV